jgi:hypothetical protein
MSLQIKPFLAIPGLTNAVTVGSSANTLTLGVNTTGLPLESIRIVNAGTAAIFVRPIASGNTTTVPVERHRDHRDRRTALHRLHRREHVHDHRILHRRHRRRHRIVIEPAIGYGACRASRAP